MEYEYLTNEMINRFASQNTVKFRARCRDEIIAELHSKNLKKELIFLNEQYQFASKHISLWKFEDDFPDNMKTAKQFTDSLIKRKIISEQQINTEWQPPLSSSPQICAIKVLNENVSIKVVEKNTKTVKSDYSSEDIISARRTSFVLHFTPDNQLVQLRCAFGFAKKFLNYIKELMLISPTMNYYTFPLITKKSAKRICDILSAGVVSRDIDIPSNIGSIRFNANKGVDLNQDKDYKKMTDLLNQNGYPTDSNNSENCFFIYNDPTNHVSIETRFEVDYKKGHYDFSKRMPEFIFDHFWEALLLAETEEKTSKLVAEIG